jgi:lipopolysaccharide heptosyltransferase II
VTRATGAPVRLGFDRARCKEASHLFTNRRIPPNPTPGVTVAQYLEFADFLGLPQQAPRWDLPLDPFPPAAVGEVRVALAVGASWESKTWPLEHWVALARALVRDLGARVHLLGGPEDRALGEEIRRRAQVDLALHAGELSLRGTAGLLASAHALVSGDTGPMHMAVAVGTPVVALFGATDPARSAPFGQPRGVLRHPTPCSPCRLRVCNVAGHPCMRGIDPGQVLERLRERLAEPRAGAGASDRPVDRRGAVLSDGDRPAGR